MLVKVRRSGLFRSLKLQTTQATCWAGWCSVSFFLFRLVGNPTYLFWVNPKSQNLSDAKFFTTFLAVKKVCDKSQQTFLSTKKHVKPSGWMVGKRIPPGPSLNNQRWEWRSIDFHPEILKQAEERVRPLSRAGWKQELKRQARPSRRTFQSGCENTNVSFKSLKDL